MTPRFCFSPLFYLSLLSSVLLPACLVGGADGDGGGFSEATDAGIFLDAGGGRNEDAGAGNRDAGEGNVGEPDAGTRDAGGPVDDDSGVPEVLYEGTYYQSVADGLTGQSLVLALLALLEDTHQRVGYDSVNAAYLTTEVNREGCDGIFDFYSEKCWGLESNLRCGDTNGFVGRCWNKEHSWPKSWWGGGSNDAYSDMFHLVPSDGQVNNRRGNLPYGEVDNPTFGGRTVNGVLVLAKMGPCVTAGAGGNCFEPADDVKGDLARGYFYMAVRYEGSLSVENFPAVTGADIESWEEDLLRDWHLLDPVDDAERRRNDLVFGLQGNRNPFIDHPEWVGRIADF